MGGSPLVPPQTSAEWARNTERRLRALENPTAVRVGEWVIAGVDGQLVAVKPGGDIDVGNPAVEATTADLTRGQVVSDLSNSVDDLNSDVTDIVTNAGATGPAEAGTKIATTIQNLQDTWNRIVEAVTGGTASGQTANDVKTQINALYNTGQTASVNAITAIGGNTSLLARLEAKVAGGSNAVADPSFENTSLYVGSGTVVRSTDVAHSGTYSVKLIGTGSSAVPMYVTTNTAGVTSFSCADGDIFYFEAYVYGKTSNTQTTGGVNGLQLVITTYNRSGTVIGDNIAANVTTTTALNATWTRVTGAVTVPSNSAFWVASVRLTSTCNSGETYYIDDVIVREHTLASLAKGVADTAATNATTAIGNGTTLKARVDAKIAMGSNIVSDPGFENTGIFIATGTTVRTTLQARTGTYSAQLTGNGSSNREVFVTADASSVIKYSCGDGDIFYFEAYVYGKSTNAQITGGTNGLQLVITPYNRAGTSLGDVVAFNQTTSTALNGAWTRITGSATMPSLTASMTASVRLTAACSNGEIYYIDDVIVREVTAGQLARGVADTASTNATTAIGQNTNLLSRFTSKVQGGSNLVTDPGFENSLMYMKDAVRTTVTKRSGSNSAQITGTGSGTKWVPFFSDTTAEIPCYAAGGDIYYLESYIYGKSTNTQNSGGANGIQLGITAVDAAGSSLGDVVAQSVTAATALKSTWTKLSGQVTLPANTASFTAWTKVNSTVNNAEVYYIDDHVIREVTLASAANTLAGTANGTANTANTNAIAARAEPILPHRIPFVSPAVIADADLNLVLTPTFETSDAVVAPATDWLFDGTQTHTVTGGSVKNVGYGKYLKSNRIDVVLGSRLDVGCWTKYSSVTATANQNAIRLSVAKYASDDTLIGTTFVSGISSPSGTLTWTELAATYTVVDATCAYIRLELGVTSAMSAGTVWFDDISAVKTNSLAETVAEVAQINVDVDTAQGTTETLQQFFNTPRSLDPWIGVLGDDVSFANTLIDGTTAPSLGQLVLIPVRVSQDRTYDAIKFGIAATTMTNCYVGLYEIDESTGNGTLVMDLGDCKAQLSTTLNLQTVSMGTTVSVQRGELYYIAVLQVGGSAAAMHRWSAATNFTTGQYPRFLGMVHATGSLSSFPSTFVTASINSGTKFWGSLGTAVAPHAPGQAFYSDGFNRTNASTLGSSWNPRYANTNDLSVETNTGYYSSTGSAVNTFVSRLATAEQEIGARFKWSTGASNNTYGMLLLRGNGAGKYVYANFKLQKLSGTATFYTVTNGLYSTPGSTLTGGTSRGSGTYSVGTDDRNGFYYADFKVTCAAKVYTAYVNGTQVAQWDDTVTNYFAYSGSNTEAGVGLARASGTSYVRVDDWYAKDLA